MAESETGVVQLSSVSEFLQQGLEMVSSASRRIRIFSHDFEPQLYGDADMAQALKEFCLEHHQNELQILLMSSRRAVNDGHRLIPLIQRLTSSVTVREVKSDYEPIKPILHSFMLVDRRKVLFRANQDQYKGFAHYDDVSTVRRLDSEFDELWRFSKTCPDFRQLNI